MEKIREIPKEKTYSEELENGLNVNALVDQLGQAFDVFLTERKINQPDELTTLRLAKIFLYEKRNDIKEICRESVFSNRDCMTLSILTCLLAGRKGFQVKVARPKKLSRYFHSLIKRGNGEIFKVAGSSTNYETLGMDVYEVIKRFKYIHPIIKTVNSINAKC